MECPICLDEPSNENPFVLLNHCGHYGHLNCIKAWITMSHKCPVCSKSCSVDCLVPFQPQYIDICTKNDSLPTSTDQPLQMRLTQASAHYKELELLLSKMTNLSEASNRSDETVNRLRKKRITYSDRIAALSAKYENLKYTIDECAKQNLLLKSKYGKRNIQISKLRADLVEYIKELQAYTGTDIDNILKETSKLDNEAVFKLIESWYFKRVQQDSEEQLFKIKDEISSLISSIKVIEKAKKQQPERMHHQDESSVKIKRISSSNPPISFQHSYSSHNKVSCDVNVLKTKKVHINKSLPHSLFKKQQ